MALALYSPEDVTILLGGIYKIEGLQEGSFLTISEPKNRWDTSVTADGSVTRTYNKDTTHSVSITLNSTADANSVFSSWALADGLLFGAMIPLLIRDTTGTSLFYSPMSWIEKVPETAFEDTVSSREWVIRTAGATHSIGGNEGSSGLLSAGNAAVGFVSAEFSGLI